MIRAPARKYRLTRAGWGMERERWNVDFSDGPWRKRIRHVAHEDRLEWSLEAPGDQAIADQVRAFQNMDTRFTGMSSFAGDWLCIPPGVWMRETQANPELVSPDTATRTAALRKWAAGRGKLWRVRSERQYFQGGTT